MADYHLERLNEDNAARWEEFNSRSAEGSIFHSLKWKRIAEKTSGISSEYYILSDGDEVVGLFPFVDHKIHLFHGLIPANNPMSLHAILKDFTDPSIMPYVIRELQNLYQDQKISFISLSSLHQEMLDAITIHPLFPYGGDGDMIIDLMRSPPEKIWNSFSSPKRKMIRRFERHGFEITEVRCEEELRLFYNYYEANINHIGGTLQPYSTIVDLWNTFSDDIRVTLLSKGSLVAGGLLQLRDRPRKTVHSVYLSLNRGLLDKYTPTYYLDWEAVNWAFENNYERFSFGLEYSSDLNENNPRYRLKRSFRAEFKPVFSALIPLTRLFSIGVRYKNIAKKMRAF